MQTIQQKWFVLFENLGYNKELVIYCFQDEAKLLLFLFKSYHDFHSNRIQMLYLSSETSKA